MSFYHSKKNGELTIPGMAWYESIVHSACYEARCRGLTESLHFRGRIAKKATIKALVST